MVRGHLQDRLTRAALAAASTGEGVPSRMLARGSTAAVNLLRRTAGAPGPLRLVTATDHRAVPARSAAPSGELVPATEVTVHPPRPWQDDHSGVPEESRRRQVPALGWSVHHDVLVNSTQLVVAGDRLIAPASLPADLAVGLRLKGPGIVASTGAAALVAVTPVVSRIDAAIRLCGFGSGNWYHWLVEIVPSATLIPHLPPELRDLPLLVPEAVLQRPAWRDALEHALPGRTLIAAPREGVVAVGTLVWIDGAVHGARTFQEHIVPDIDHSAPVLPALELLRSRVRAQVELRDRPDRRILLVRPEGSQRSANQSELIAVARRHGLTPVDPGGLDFADQVRLFAEAELIAGGWGAAWSSMLFADPRTRALMWAPERFRRWTLFSNLAQVSGMTLRHLHVPIEGGGFKAANTAPQHIPPDVFDAALRSLD